MNQKLEEWDWKLQEGWETRRKIENYENDVKLGEGWETRRRIGNQEKDWKL